MSNSPKSSALTMNHNALFMKEMYGIVSMIAAFTYSEVIVNDGFSYTSDEDRARGWRIANVMPWGFMVQMGEELASMAGWRMMDNKVAFLVDIGFGRVNLITFYDNVMTMLPIYHEVPPNVVQGREKVQTALDAWKKTR